MRGRCLRVFRAFVASVALFGAVPLAAEDGSASLHAGAVELGISGSMTTVEGVTSGNVLLRGGYFLDALAGLVSIEAGWGFHHIESLDETELELTAAWQRRFRQSTTYPYASVGGGIRNEEIGSFGSVRYPLGFALGARSLVGRRGGFRVEYRYRRVLNDPIADFSEHHVSVGLSLFFRNGKDTRAE